MAAAAVSLLRPALLYVSSPFPSLCKPTGSVNKWFKKNQTNLLGALGNDCDAVLHEVPDENLRGRLAVLGRQLQDQRVLQEVAQGVGGRDDAAWRKIIVRKNCI